jgi:hypothetical protein
MIIYKWKCVTTIRVNDVTLIRNIVRISRMNASTFTR